MKQKTLNKKEAINIWNGFLKWALYGFNKSHSVEYAMLAYWCAWAKYNYPIEFVCANLTYGKDSKKKDQTKELTLPSVPDNVTKHLREHLDDMQKLPELFDIKPFEGKPFIPDDSINNRIEKQLEKLQKRIEELEKRLGENSKDSPDEQKIKRKNKSTWQESQNKVRV